MTDKTFKYCPKCRTTHPVAKFSKNKARSDGLNSWCKNCINTQHNLGQYNAKRADKQKLRAREYRKTPEYKEYIKEYRKKRSQGLEGQASRLWLGAKQRAKEKGLDITITTDWVVEKLQPLYCEATGVELTLTHDDSRDSYRTWNRPSLDRIDSTLGYTPENTRVVSVMYNTAKADYTDQQMYELAQAIINFKDRGSK